MTEHNDHQTFKTNEIPSQEISDPAVLPKNPVVSVHMITYNHEPYIAQAIEGVLMQETDFPIELVIGEDRSTDRTREIVLEYQKKYLDIIKGIFRKENVGSLPNFIDTFKYCKGKYIAICEGDDYWTDPYKLQKQVDFLEANPDYGLVYTEIDMLDVKLNGLERSSFKNKLGIHDNTFEDFLINAWFLATCTWVFRKELLEDSEKLFQELNGGPGDLKLLLLISSKAKVKFISKPTSVYRILENSASHFTDRNQSLEFKKNVFKIQKFFAIQNKVNQEIIDRIMDKYYLGVLTLSCLLNDTITKEKAFLYLKSKNLLKLKKKILCYLTRFYIGRAVLLLKYR